MERHFAIGHCFSLHKFVQHVVSALAFFCEMVKVDAMYVAFYYLRS